MINRTAPGELLEINSSFLNTLNLNIYFHIHSFQQLHGRGDENYINFEGRKGWQSTMICLSVDFSPTRLIQTMYTNLTALHFRTLFMKRLLLSSRFCWIQIDRSLTDSFFISSCIAFKAIISRLSKYSLQRSANKRCHVPKMVGKLRPRNRLRLGTPLHSCAVWTSAHSKDNVSRRYGSPS